MVNEPKADVVYLLTYEGFTLRYAYCNVVCLARDGWPGCARSHGVDPPCPLCHSRCLDIEAASHAP